MNYKKKYLKYKKKYLMTKKINGGYFDRPLHNDINNEIDVYISIKYIKSTIFSAFLNYLNGTDDYTINGKKLFLLKKKIQEIKSKNFTIIDVTFETSNEGKFNGIIVTLNKTQYTLLKEKKLKENKLKEKKLKEQKLELKDIDGSMYKELLLNIDDENVIYDSIFVTTTNIKRKKNCIKEANKKLEKICRTKDGNKEIYKCKAKESAIDDCIHRCVLPYKKSKFVINNHRDDDCIADEQDKH